MNQVAQDWQTVPFVNITVVDDHKCPNDTDLVFDRVWYGTRQGCYCDTNTMVWAYDVISNNRPASKAVGNTAGTVRAGFKANRECTYDELYNRKTHLTCWNVPA